MNRLKQVISTLWKRVWFRVLLFLVGLVLILVGLGWLLMQSGVTEQQLDLVTQFVSEGRYAFFIARLILLSVILVNWDSIVTRWRPSAASSLVENKYWIGLGILTFDVLFILKLPFNGV